MITTTKITARTITTTITTTTMIVVLGSFSSGDLFVAIGVMETEIMAAAVVVGPTVKINILKATKNHENEGFFSQNMTSLPALLGKPKTVFRSPFHKLM